LAGEIDDTYFLDAITINIDRIDWLIDYLQFYVPLKNVSLIWRRHHCRWRAAKFRLMLGAQGLWAGRDLYRATPAATRDLGFKIISGLIRRTAPFSRLLRHAWGCGGPRIEEPTWYMDKVPIAYDDAVS
jgi:hypothetical protein